MYELDYNSKMTTQLIKYLYTHKIETVVKGNQDPLRLKNLIVHEKQKDSTLY